MQDFMNDRYGADELTYLVGGIGLVLALVGSLAAWRWMGIIALIFIALALFRAFSKNIEARKAENAVFLGLLGKIPGMGHGAGAPGAQGDMDFGRAQRIAKKMWSKRKDSKFLRCRNCGQIMSVPRGKGHIRVTCPHCGLKSEIDS